MLSTKIRTSIIALVASAGFATATIAPAISQAQPIGNESAVGCEYNGESFGTGDRVVVFSGAHYDTYYCGSDGEWHLVEHQIVQVGATKKIAVTISGTKVAHASLR